MAKHLRRMTTAAGLAVAATAALGTISTPAWAVDSSCTISSGDTVCSTGTISANSTYRAIYIEADSFHSSVTVTCRAYDAHNGSEVGIVSAGKGDAKWKVVRGLYGLYFVVCISNGYSEGVISNEEWRVN